MEGGLGPPAGHSRSSLLVPAGIQNGVLCEDYQELTPFLGYSHVLLIQKSHIFKWADEKNWSTTLHQIFRVCRGHKGQHNYVILRGEGEEKFLTSHISPLGGQGALKFFCVTEIYKPHVLTKYCALEFKRGYGGRNQFFCHFCGSPAVPIRSWTP